MSINNKGLFKNDDARRMLRNMGGVKRPTGILASSKALMDAVAMPRKQTGQGQINPRALAGQFGTTVNSPTTMNRNAMSAPMGQMQMQMQPQMAMAQGPVAGMPNVQTEYNMGGPVQGYNLGGLLRAGVDDLIDIAQPAKGMSAPQQTYANYKKLGIMTLGGGAAGTAANAAINVGNPFSTEEFGEEAEGLNRELQDAADIASKAGNTEAGARELILQLGGNPEGNVKDELNKIYNGVSGKKIPPSQKDRIDGSIQAIVGATTMAARGNDMQRIAAGLKAGAQQRLAMEKAAAGAKGSEYTRQRAYDRILEELVKGALQEDSEFLQTPANLEALKQQAASLAGAVQPGGGSSAPAPSATRTPNASHIAALKKDPSQAAVFDEYFGSGAANKILG